MKPVQTLAVIASALGLVMTGIYVAVIVSQGGDYKPGTVVFAALMVIASIAPLLAQRLEQRRYLGIAAGIFFVVGILGIPSIGLPFLIAGILALAAFTRFEGQA